MVTIGPLIFLGLLGVTFHIGANSVRPAATIRPISGPEHSRFESDTNTIPGMETPASGAVLRRGRTWDASEGTFQAVEPACSGPRVQRRGTWDMSGDYVTVPHSAGRTITASCSTGQDMVAGGKRESSGINNPSSNLDDATVSRQDSPMVHTIVDSVVKAEPNPSASLEPLRGSLRKSRRQSLRSVWTAGPPTTVANPQQVKLLFRCCFWVPLGSYIPSRV